MSTTTTSISSAPSPASTCTANIYDTPDQDAVCAMPDAGNHTAIMTSCCGAADVIGYYGGCGLYCRAEGQSVADLRDCLFGEGAGWADVFCSGNLTATATAADDASLPTGADASVVASGSGSGESSSSKTGSGSTSTSTSSGNAAVRRTPDVGLTTMGFTIGALLFTATTLGAFALQTRHIKTANLSQETST
ncbi:hypothetical protein KJ359_004674 [Pestalotiopsis sp. 9143b]|nr:hypothetical protein KJ359_004674 [Pestalotiopsis sp. 9143b]